MEFILASQSPRRAELLKKVVPEFSIIQSGFDENTIAETDPVEFAVKAALSKAREVGEKFPSAIILGSDTVVAIDREILGKPKDLADAKRMLGLLSNSKHKVITGMALYKKDEAKMLTDYEITYVQFKNLTDQDIGEYLATGDHVDKAGSYAVQKIGDRFVEKIEGSFDNVVGLPTERLKKLLKKFNAREFTAEITDVALPDNLGVAKAENKVYFVPGALLGGTLLLREAKRIKGVAYAEIVKVIKDSPYKETAPCPHFGPCGGCIFQNLKYEKQLELKENYLRQTLIRIGNIDFLPSPVSHLPCLTGRQAPPGNYYYRNKMEFAFDKSFLGLRERFNPLKRFQRRSVPLSECMIFSRQVKKIFPAVLDFAKNREGLRHLIVREGKATGELMITLSTRGENISGIELLAKELIKSIPDLKSFYWAVNDQVADVVDLKKTHLVYGKEYINEKIKDLTFRIYPRTFFQPNTLGAEMLYEKIAELADLKGLGRVLGLYCGSGAIEIFLARKAKEIIGIDMIAENISCAKENCTANNIANCTFLEGDVEKVLKNNPLKADLIILDPPRSGLSNKAIEQVLRLKTPRIIYVSCNPATLARDLGIFQENKYAIKSIHPFDLFPHTAHLETVALLEYFLQ